LKHKVQSSSGFVN